jgi:cyanosortase A-associated protein
VNSWQQVKIKYLSQFKYKNLITDKFKIVECRKDYSYFKNGHKLVVQMGYVVNRRGQSNPFVYQLSKNLVKDSQNNIRQLKEVGYYTLYNNSKQAYLTACINPQGGSSVTSSQFMTTSINTILAPIICYLQLQVRT